MFIVFLKCYSLSLENRGSCFLSKLPYFSCFIVANGQLLLLRDKVGQKPALNILCLQGIKLCNNVGGGVGAGLLLFHSVSLISKFYLDSLTNPFLP